MTQSKMPQRKPNRLSNYDYSTSGAYFITVCTKDRKQILCKIVGEGLCALPKTELTAIGKKTDEAINFIECKYKGVYVDKYVIMPNHLHLIIRLTGGHGDPPLQNIIGLLKSYTTHLYGKPLWQRSFYDHVIRNENDYGEIWRYIDTNPQKWHEDRFYVAGSFSGQ